MNYKIKFALALLLVAITTQLNLIPDPINPVTITSTGTTGGIGNSFLGNPTIVLKFSFPQGVTNALGPAGLKSPGLTYKQFFGVVFPVEFSELTLTDSTKYTCGSLVDNSSPPNKYVITAVPSIAGTLTTTLAAEKNIAYCRFDDLKSLVAGVTYTLTISLTTTLTTLKFMRNISLFTSTSNNPDKLILDSFINMGSTVQYPDWTSMTTKPITVSNPTVAITSPASITGQTIVAGYTFDLTVTLAFSSSFAMADHIFVVRYPSTVKAPTSIVSGVIGTTAALGGNFSVQSFDTNAFYISGITEDINTGRTFTLTFRGWMAYEIDTTTTTNWIELYTYYKNTYSIVAYQQMFNIKVVQPTLTLTVNHPEYWDIYRNGAWPLTFTFTTNAAMNSTFVVIQQTNTIEIGAGVGNKMSFIASTCDLSNFETTLSTKGDFGSRFPCYPLRTDTAYPTLVASPTPYAGSGIFFNLNTTLTASTTAAPVKYSFTVWVFADNCGGTYASPGVVANNNYFVKPTFSLTIYKSIDNTQIQENRFKSSLIVGSALSDGSGLTCWNNLIKSTGAAEGVFFTSADIQLNLLDPSTVSPGGAVLASQIMYREITDWKIQTFTASSYAVTTLWGFDMTVAFGSEAFLYTSTPASSAVGSFFLVYYKSPVATVISNYPAQFVPSPYTRIATAGATFNGVALQKGQVTYQFSYQWFDIGLALCYIGWGNTDKTTSGTYTQAKLVYQPSDITSVATNYASNAITAGSQFTTDSSTFISNLAPTSKSTIVQITSIWSDNSVFQYQVASKVEMPAAGKTMEWGWSTTCLKWRQPAAIKTIYTYIDVQIKYSWKNNIGDTAYPTGNTRLIKLFPEGGVVQDIAKKSSALAASTYINHVNWLASPVTAMCLLEINSTQLTATSDSVANTLILWLFWGTLLETDYADATATYPVGNASVPTWGLQSAPPMTSDNNYLTGTTSPLSNALIMPSNYIFYMGSVLLFTTISGKTISSGTNGGNNVLIPYYCPIFNVSTTMGGYPFIMGSWLTMSTYSSITNVNKIIYGSASVAVSVSTTKTDAAEAVYQGVIRFAPQAVVLPVALMTQLYIINGQMNASTYTANANDVKCSGFSFLFTNSMVYTPPTAPVLATYSNSNVGMPFKASSFFFLGANFNNGVFVGAGTGTAAITLAKTDPTLETPTPTVFLNGFTRPTADAFVPRNSIAFSCSNAFGTDVNVLTNYYSVAAGSGFLVDWNKQLTQTSGWNTSSPALTIWTTSDIYKADPAGNLKVALVPPHRLPKGATINFSSTSLSSNSICAIDGASNSIGGPQCSNSSGTISCLLDTFYDSLNLCCYSITISDTITLSTLTVSPPPVLAVATPTIDAMISPVILSATAQITALASAASVTAGWTIAGTNTNASALPTALVTSLRYIHVDQEGGIGKAIFTVSLQRSLTRDMKITIMTSSAALGAMVADTNFPPRCYASYNGEFEKTGVAKWDSDVMLDSCSLSGISTTSPIVIYNKKIIYKCGQTFEKFLYISLWPVLQVKFDATILFSVKLTINASDAVSTVPATGTAVTQVDTALSTKPISQTSVQLCPVIVSPPIPGELADYTFLFDLDTSATAMAGSVPNEFSIFFPYKLYGSYIENVICTQAGVVQNCAFGDEGVLNIRFATTLAIGSGTKVSIIVSGVLNPYSTTDITLLCSINNFDNTKMGTETSGVVKRKNIVVGTAKITGGITTNAVAASIGSLKFQNLSPPANSTVILPPYITDLNPRNSPTLTFKVTIDIGSGLNIITTIAKTPMMYIYFPSDFNLAYYSAKLVVTVDEYTLGSDGTISKSTSRALNAPTVSGNKVTIVFTDQSFVLTATFRYWLINISNFNNPSDSSIKVGPPPIQSTKPFFITLTNSDYSQLYRTATNANTFLGDPLTSVTVPLYYSNTRGINFVYSGTQSILDEYTNSAQLNSVVVKSGRYSRAVIRVRNPTGYTLSNTVITTGDSIFKILGGNITISNNVTGENVFYLGVPCGTSPGSYITNFASSNSTTFRPLPPILTTISADSAAIISLQPYTSAPIGGTIWIGYMLSDINFDAFDISWTVTTGSATDASSKITNCHVNAGTITPQTSTIMSSIYSEFSNSITATTTAPGPQQFTTTDPNTCYTFNKATTISIVVTGSPTSLTAVALAPMFLQVPDTTIPKNAIHIKFTPSSTAFPMFLYCALYCSNSAVPADADVLAAQTKSSSYLLKYYYNIVPSATGLDIVFQDLVRGINYSLKCIGTSTQASASARTQASATMVSLPASSTNATALNITASPLIATQGLQFNFLVDPGLSVVKKIVDYCQKFFSTSGGGMICQTINGSIISDGVAFSKNTLCTAPTSKSKLRFLQATPAASTATTTNTTTVNYTVYSVFAAQNPTSPTDPFSTTAPSRLLFSFSDYFTTFTKNLQTSAAMQITLGVSAISLASVLTLNDNTPPTLPTLTITTNPDLTGNYAFTLSNPNSEICSWVIQSSGAVPTSYSAVSGSQDPSWAGTVTVNGGITAVVSTPKTLKPFVAATTYTIYYACTNTIPKSMQFTTIGSQVLPVIPAPTVTTNATTTTTSSVPASSNYFNCKVAIFLTIIFFLF